MNMIAKFAALGVVGLVASTLGGCATISPYPYGSIYNGVTQPHAMDREEVAGAAKTGDKEGEACATGILGLAAWGDASVDAAKKAGAISDVHSVELKSFGILGALYSKGCTIVHCK